jgi:uncharacterized membrane protein YkvA (DUF1232 family)
MDSATPMLWREPNFVMRWRLQAQRLRKEAHVFYFVFKDPRTRWYTRCVAACTAGYLFSPVQIIPSFIPVIGFLDDFLVLFLGAKAVRRLTPPEVLRECRALADAAETRRKEEIRSGIARFTFFAIAASWLLAAVTVSALVAAYIYH